MILRHDRGKVTWVDIEAPTREELRAILHEFKIDARVEEEIITPTPYSLFIPFPDYLFLVLHFPTADEREGAKNQEIDFIVAKDFIITARYEVIDSIHNLHKIFEAEELLGVAKGTVKTQVLLERLMRRMYGALGREAENVAARLDRIERDIYAGREKEMVRALSEVGRTLLRFETSLAHHDEALKAFIGDLSTPAFFGKGFVEHGAHISAERDHAAHLVHSYQAVMRELRDTNDSLLSTSQNEVMKVLTIMAFVTFPLTLISSIFGMNTDYLPIVGLPGDFWFVIGLMILLALGFFSFFRFKKWL